MATDLGIRHEAIRMIKDHFERVDHKILDKLCRDHDYEDGQGLATDYWSIHEMKHGWIDPAGGVHYGSIEDGYDPLSKYE